MDSLDIVSNSAERTRRIGARLGEVAAAGDIVLLVGALGVGKTCLTQGIAQGLGVAERATSPSFVLIREYRGRLPLYHIDFYRLDKVEEVAELGLDDYLHGNGVCVVEWADKGLAVLPSEHLLIEMAYAGPTRRSLTVTPSGARYQEMLAHLRGARMPSGK